MSERCVVDASALAALLFGEPAAGAVARALGNRALVAPSLLDYELASVTARKARVRPAEAETAFACLDRMERLSLARVEVPARAAAEVALGRGLTAYDGAYLWLAEFLRADLVTLDGDLARAAGTVPVG